MIKFNSDSSDKAAVLMIKGSPKEIAVECLAMISAIKGKISEYDTLEGMIFDITILQGIEFALMGEEDKDKALKRQKEINEQSFEDLAETIDKMGDILKAIKELHDMHEDIRKDKKKDDNWTKEFNEYIKGGDD